MSSSTADMANVTDRESEPMMFRTPAITVKPKAQHILHMVNTHLRNSGWDYKPTNHTSTIKVKLESELENLPKTIQS